MALWIDPSYPQLKKTASLQYKRMPNCPAQNLWWCPTGARSESALDKSNLVALIRFMSSIYCLLDYPIISWAQISDQMRTASYFFWKTFPPNIWINSKFSNFLQIFLISAASSLLTGEESKCATDSYHLLQICHFLYFFGNFFTFQKRNVFTHNVFHSCIFPCEESFFQSHTKSYWQKLFFIFRGEESICATHSSAATGLFYEFFFIFL